jgi:hypothetical protein
VALGGEAKVMRQVTVSAKPEVFYHGLFVFPQNHTHHSAITQVTQFLATVWIQTL